MNVIAPVLTFMAGIVMTYMLMTKYDAKMFDMWETAYGVGKADGFGIAKAQFEMNRDKLEYTCAFLWWDESDVQKHRKK